MTTIALVRAGRGRVPLGRRGHEVGAAAVVSRGE